MLQLRNVTRWPRRRPALIRLEDDPDARIPCPACAASPLRVLDVEVAGSEDERGRVHIARYLVCDTCRAGAVADGRRRSRGSGDP